jgi:hypothetical protein
MCSLRVEQCAIFSVKTIQLFLNSGARRLGIYRSSVRSGTS